VYIIKLLDIFDIKTQIKANNIVNISCLIQLFLSLFFYCIISVTLVLSYINNKKKRVNLKKKISKLKKKIENKKKRNNRFNNKTKAIKAIKRF